MLRAGIYWAWLDKMNYTLDYNNDSGYFHVVAEGVAQVMQLQKMTQDMANHPGWSLECDTLLDFSELTFATLDTDEIVQLSNMIRALSEFLGGGKAAMVVNQDVDFGLARMWQMMTEHHVEFSIDVFSTIEKAHEFLTSESPINAD